MKVDRRKNEGWEIEIGVRIDKQSSGENFRDLVGLSEGAGWRGW